MYEKSNHDNNVLLWLWEKILDDDNKVSNSIQQIQPTKNINKNWLLDTKLHQISNISYESGIPMDNTQISSILYNSVNYSSYNFKINDKLVNDIITLHYVNNIKKYINLLNNTIIPTVEKCKQYKGLFDEQNNNLCIPINTINTQISDLNNDYLHNDLKYSIMEPLNVVETDTQYKINFKVPSRSDIYSNILDNSMNTEILLVENKDINKKDYAYITLFFPGKNKKKYSYLIGTLMVAYLLKNRNHNYDLSKNKLKGTKANVICMVTNDIENNIIDILKIYYDEVIVVPYISWELTDGILITDVSKGNIKKRACLQ